MSATELSPSERVAEAAARDNRRTRRVDGAIFAGTSIVVMLVQTFVTEAAGMASAQGFLAAALSIPVAGFFGCLILMCATETYKKKWGRRKARRVAIGAIATIVGIVGGTTAGVGRGLYSPRLAALDDHTLTVASVAALPGSFGSAADETAAVVFSTTAAKIQVPDAGALGLTATAKVGATAPQCYAVAAVFDDGAATVGEPVRLFVGCRIFAHVSDDACGDQDVADCLGTLSSLNPDGDAATGLQGSIVGGNASPYEFATAWDATKFEAAIANFAANNTLGATAGTGDNAAPVLRVLDLASERSTWEAELLNTTVGGLVTGVLLTALLTWFLFRPTGWCGKEVKDDT